MGDRTLKEINPKPPTERSPAQVILDFLTGMLVQERVRKEIARRRRAIGSAEGSGASAKARPGERRRRRSANMSGEMR
jgi:hypothetical protein